MSLLALATGLKLTTQFSGFVLELTFLHCRSDFTKLLTFDGAYVYPARLVQAVQGEEGVVV